MYIVPTCTRWSKEESELRVFDVVLIGGLPESISMLNFAKNRSKKCKPPNA